MDAIAEIAAQAAGLNKEAGILGSAGELAQKGLGKLKSGFGAAKAGLGEVAAKGGDLAGKGLDAAMAHPKTSIGLGLGAAGAGAAGTAMAMRGGSQDASRGTTTKPGTGQGGGAQPKAKPAASAKPKPQGGIPGQPTISPKPQGGGGGGGILQWIMANPGKASLLGLLGGGATYGLYRLLGRRKGKDEEKEGSDRFMTKEAMLKRAAFVKRHNATQILNAYLVKAAADADDHLAASFRTVRSQLTNGQSISTAMARAFPKMAAERRTILAGRLCKQAMDDFIKQAAMPMGAFMRKAVPAAARVARPGMAQGGQTSTPMSQAFAQKPPAMQAPSWASKAVSRFTRPMSAVGSALGM